MRLGILCTRAKTLADHAITICSLAMISPLTLPAKQRLVKSGGRLIQHARYYWLLVAEGHLSGGCLPACCGRSRCCRRRRDKVSAKRSKFRLRRRGRREKCRQNRWGKRHLQ